MPHRLARLLAALICIASFAVLTPPAHSEDSIEQAKDDREAARRAQLEAESELDALAAEDEQVVAALEAATELVNLEQAKVDAATQRLDIANDTLREAESKLADAAAAIDLLRQVAVEYAVESYVGLSESRTETWLEAEDATTAAHKLALLDTVSSETTDVLDRLRAIEEYRRDLLDQADGARAQANAIEAELSVALADLEAKKQVQVELKAELDARKAKLEAELAAAEAEEAKLSQFIKEEEARREEERKRKAEAARRAASSGGLQANVGVISASGWTWPTSGGVHSGFGQRMHPILGYMRMHSGLDIGGQTGQPVWAATEGLVIRAGWNSSGYGNHVVIQHANGVSTVYAHMSAVYVQNGDYVLTGDSIGAVGSTGLSTGPHLHFEVRVNGVPVDPIGWLP